MIYIYIFIIFIILFPINNSKAQTWSAVGPGLNNVVFALIADTINNILYAGGSFDSYMGGPMDSTRNIAKWDGFNWSAVGSGKDLSLPMGEGINSFQIKNNELFAGGDFSYYDDTTNLSSLLIAKWDGVNWHGMASGFYQGTGGIRTVWDIAIFNNEIIAAGSFLYIFDPVPANWDTTNCIAKWNGTNWVPLGTGVNGPIANVSIRVLEVYNGELYAGGFFTLAGGNPVNKIAKWNGTNWLELPGYPGWPVPYCFAVYNGELYIAGLGWLILKWDGFVLDTVGIISGVNAQIHALAVYKNELIAGGFFDTINGMSANNIAKWDGINWTALGSGTSHLFGNGSVEALTVLNSELYVGGWFDQAGGVSASFIAKWCDPICDTSTNIEEKDAWVRSIKIYPHPNIGQFILLIQRKEPASIYIYNLLGKVVYQKDNIISPKLNINISNQPAGVYFVKIQSEEQIITKKIIIIK